MRKLLSVLFIFIALKAIAQQPFNNEWIDYNKTYYKFKVGNSGLYHINQTALATIGLQSTPVEQFQLWRNGKQVPLYTSVSAGAMGSSDYIEFWGKRNDGKPDVYLYKDPSFQLSDRVSLQTDTAAFFLTVNPNPSTSNPNLRFTLAQNNIPTTPPTPLASFNYTQNIDFENQINPGFAENAGEYVYSSSYDLGEFWGSQGITTATPLSVPLDNLYAAPTGSSATLQGAFVANIDGQRTVQLGFNNDNVNVATGTLGDLAPTIVSATVPITTLTGSPKSLNMSINSTSTFDVVVCNYIKLTYPRLFNFGGQTNFFFNLPASTQSNYLQITNFSAGNAVPVLYDFTNNLYYNANTSITGTLQFYLPSSTTATEYLLMSEDASINGVTNITSFQQRNFVNYASQSNQGDYLIISNKALGLTSGGAVDQYRAYRSINNIFNPKVYDIDDLEDQFAFGIKKHPLSIKNFIRYASSVFAKVPTYVLLIGKGVTYDQYRYNQNSPFADKLNLVPTWGWPASDAMLVSPSSTPDPTIGIGRIPAVTQAEVNIYLNKVKEYEGLVTLPQTVEAKGWMKNIVHVAGADDASLNGTLIQYLNGYQGIIQAPFFGANVYNFNKTTTGAVTGGDARLVSLINNGVGLLTYFGHGSSTVVDYANLNEPTNFSNSGKYPMFLINGCSVGNFFDFDTARMSVVNSYSEKFIFAPELGAIGVIGNSHFGLTTDLDTYSTGFYKSLSSTGYNTGVATNMLAAISALKTAAGGNFNDYYTRTHAEETVLAGDPAIRIYASNKPDFVIEPQNVVISPSVLSVADKSFGLKAYLYNIGKFTTDSFVNVTITHVYPNGTTAILYNQKRANFAYLDSVILTVPIVGSRDKGTNQIIVTINGDKIIDEITFGNNTATTSFTIFDNGITPVYPYNYAIVNKQNIQLVASTANPLAPSNTYVMDLDTSALFTTPLVSQRVSSTGGAISFPLSNFTFTDSTVYYWRVAQVPASGAYVYNTSSFVYLKNVSSGFNQSHVYQHLNSTMSRMYLDSTSRQWGFLPDSNNVLMRLGIFPTSATEPAQFATLINGLITAQEACIGHSIIFNVYDPLTLQPLYNQTIPSTTAGDQGGKFMGSAANCTSPDKPLAQYNFEFQLFDAPSRQIVKDFMDWIPKGYLVTARLNWDISTPYIPYASTWAGDSTVYGDTTLYNEFKSIGFYDVDSFYKPRTFGLIYKKGVSSFKPKWLFSDGINDAPELSMNVIGTDTLGYVTSPQFGPAYKWHQLKWRGSSLQSKLTSSFNMYVIGVDTLGNQTPLLSFNNTVQDVDISSINATQYPYIQLMQRNVDSINQSPYQLRYWRVLADLVPEGAMAPNIKYVFADSANKTAIDTFQAGELIKLAIAFKNISDTTFRDSISVQAQILDNSNNVNILPVSKLKKLVSGDTAVVYLTINTANFVGNNTLYLNVNPNNSQPEQYHFNNFIYKSFYVLPDNTAPVLDVTFDGTHILNNDIISSKPNIQVKLVENSKYLLLTDTSAISVQLLYPDGTLHQFNYNSDTLRFIPASPNGSENAAVSILSPALTQDGTYELIVSGKNKAGLMAGALQYKVQFQVINKAMISNVFNYPNPFTTSTAFVFTLTGSTVPQNLKIEILTVSGRIVKEITRDQLGPLHIGNNITTYKWDGTDMFGAKLGNGVYLYRVVTRLNGNSIDKYGSDAGGPNTDMYFKGGYGKMYLMR